MIGCLIVNHFRERAELARRPQLADCAGVIVERSGRRAVVVDTLPAIRGAVAGMRLSEARSLEPDAVLIEADEPHYRQAFERMLCALEQVGGRVEGAELGVAYVGLDGLDGPAAGRDDLLGAVPEHFRPRIGIGANKFTSLVAARARRSPGATIVPGDAAAFLAPHPIGLLPCSSGLLNDLRRLGLRTLGDVAAPSRCPTSRPAWNLAPFARHTQGSTVRKHFSSNHSGQLTLTWLPQNGIGTSPCCARSSTLPVVRTAHSTSGDMRP